MGSPGKGGEESMGPLVVAQWHGARDVLSSVSGYMYLCMCA